jgi:adenylate cyclase
MFLAVGAIAVAVGLAAYASDVLRQLELDTLDARFALRGEQTPPRDVVLVEIDDRSFGALDEQWPFPRSLHGAVIDRLRRDGAKAIGYDIQFTEPTTQKEDDALIGAVARARGTVLATTEVDDEGRANVFGGEDVLREIGARAGNAGVTPDGDGVRRRVAHTLEGLETFPVALAEAALGRPVRAASFAEDPALIDFAGPPGTIPSVSFSDVLRGRFPPGTFKDKIVVVGSSAPTLQDVHPTSASRDELMSGAELQANAVGTVMAGTPLARAGGWLEVALIVVFGLAAPAGSLALRSVRGPLLALLLAVVLLVGAQLAFGAGLVVGVVYPLLALAIGIVGSIAVYALTGALERERERDLFRRFVPERVVDDLLAQADGDLRLGGVERECTVMFCDLRKFTSFAESRPAGVVIEVVNVFLGEMSDAILAAGGTLIAYLGDGLMAVFGAPVVQDDHADRALRAARDMMGPRLERFNTWLLEHGHEEGFRMGIGLNTGTVVAGNVGSERRLEYTAIGDTSNTASRLEGLTRGAGHMLLIAESTKQALREPPDDLELLGEFEVRGRAAKLVVWSVPDPGTPAPAAGERVDSAPGD